MEIDQPRRRSERREANRRRRDERERLALQVMEEENVNQQENQQEIPNPEQQQDEQQPLQNNQPEVNQEGFQNPILQGNNNQQIVKVSPAIFTNKIPNIDALRDFFTHQCQRYCPTVRDMTTSFAKKVLAGDKKLLKLNEILWVKNAPRYQEISSKKLWQEVKSDKKLTIYMPEYPNSRYPQKAYLLNIMNTLRPNSVIKFIKELQKKREMIVVEQSPIMMTAEFSNLLQNFETISTNKRSSRGLNGLRTRPERENCCICFSEMNLRNPMMLFQCKRHKGHQRCVNAYYNNRQNNNHLCPFRCDDVAEN